MNNSNDNHCTRRRGPGLGTSVLITLLLVLGPVGDVRAVDGPDSQDLVDEVMAYLGFDTSHRQALLEGEILFYGKPDLEPLPQAVAVAGAMLLIERPWTELIASYLSAETLRAHASVLDYGLIPERGGDASVLDDLKFDPGEHKELRRLLRAQPGDKLNLAANEIERFARIEPGDTATAEAARVFREVLWDRVSAYRAMGLRGIAPYARRSGGESNPAVEMTASLDSARMLQKHFPGFHAALRHYPDRADDVTDSQLLWMKKTLSDRPLVALVHRLVLVEDDLAVAAEREFYASHSYNSMLTLVGVAPYADGALVFAANRTFSEKVDGGAFRKALGRKTVGKKLGERLARLRASLESAVPP